MAKSKEQNYLHGAAILTVGVIIMKILGAIYKIPIKNMLGDDGYSLFLSAYNVYAMFLTLATAGLPVALSRMISKARSNGRQMQARRTFHVAWWTFFAFGLICSLIMFLFPEKLAELLNNPETARSIWVLSPSVLLVCLVSAYRGYTQGHENMIPTTISQVLEVLVKVIVGLVLAWYIMKTTASKTDASAGAIFGVTAGSVATLLYMLLCMRKNYRFTPLAEPDVPDPGSEIFKDLLRIGIPIALGSVVLSIINVLDSGLCMGRLQSAAGFSYDEAQTLYGVYGAAQTLFNLPASFITPLTISVVPAIAAFIAHGNKAQASGVSEDSMRISTAVALPMGIGLAVLSDPIMNVIYPGSHEAGPVLLALLGIAAFFVCYSLMSTAVLQANGLERYPVYSIIAGGLVKVGVNWILIGNPDINITGAPIGTISCYLTMCLLNHIFMCRKFEKAPSLANIFLRPCLASLIMGAVACLSYYGASRFLPTDTRLGMLVCMAAAIVLAVIAYAVAAIKLRAVTREDMKLIPKGEKIAALLHMK